MLFQTLWFRLLLLTALSGVSTACPLILQPYLKQEIDDQIFVNCTTLADGHKGLSWSYNNRTTDEELDSFTEVSIRRSDRNTTAKCTIKLNDTYECSKYIQLKAYDLEKDTETENNQHEFKCDIPEGEPVQNLSVKWYKEGQIIGPESTPKDVHSPLVLNISREHEGVTFACEALWHREPHGQVYVSKIWNFSVKYAPKFEDKNETMVHLSNIGAISLDCKTTGNPPPDYEWFKNGSVVAKTSYLNISHVNENTTYYCNASNDIGFDTREFDVTVSPSEPITPKPPKSSDCPVTIIPNKLFVEYGGPASANCSTVVDPDGMGWEADENGISLTERKTSLVWNVTTVKKWKMEAQCFINLKNGTQCVKPLNITIFKLPDKVQLSPDGNRQLVEGQEHKLQCEISNVAPVEKVQVKWYQDNQYLQTEMFSNETDRKPQNKTSSFTLTPKKEQNKANFTCEIEILREQGQNPKRVSPPYTANVQYKPVIEDFPPNNCTTREFHMGQSLTLNCSADGNPLPQLHWKYPNAPNVNVTARGRQIYITEATSANAGPYSCNATNDVGSVTRTVTLIMKEKAHINHTIVLIFALLALILLATIILGLVYRNYKQKSGHYNVIAISDSVPLTSR